MKPIRAWTLGLAVLACLALPRVADAGQKIFFGDIDFNEEIENQYQPSRSVLDLNAEDNEDGGPVSIKVEGPGAGYAVRLLKRGCKITDPVIDCPGQGEAPSPGIGLPTILTIPSLVDLNNTKNGGSWYEIEVEATLGTATMFKTTVSPLQQPPVVIAPGTCQSGSLLQGETDTYEFTLTAPQLGATGEVDVWFDDISVAPGSNTVELFDATQVVSKGVLSQSSDVSLDNSEIDTLKLTAAGTYRVNIRNTNLTGQGNYQVCVGPLPEAVCPAITLGVANVSSLAEIGDRDCYTLALGTGTELLRINLTETGGTTPGTNEVRVVRTSPSSPVFDVSVTGATNIDKTVPVGATGGEIYQLTVNNLDQGQPNYSFTVTTEGACLGTSCVLVPGGSVRVPISDGGVRPIQSGVGAASFEVDPGGSGTWTFQVQDATNAVLCQITSAGSTTFYLDNCNVGGGTQPAHIKMFGPSTGTAVISMGPDLGEAAKVCVPLDSGDFGIPVSEILGDAPALVGGGDEDCYEFQAGFNEWLGLDFETLSISNTKTACIYHYDGAPAHDWRRNPVATAEHCFSGTGDGTTGGSLLTAGEDYQVVVDTDKWDDGSYDLCLGPEANADMNEGDTLTLPANQTLAVSSGLLDACGDADRWTIANGALVARNVEIEVEEDEAVAGKIYAATPSNAGSATTRVTIPATLPASGSVLLTIDHDKFTFGNYVVRVRTVP